MLTNHIESEDDQFLGKNISALLYFQSGKTLNWIEKISSRIVNLTSWGQLAASSEFSWLKAEEWLSIGRPLSLIALDSLVICTTTGDRLNQSLWLKKIKPKLIDSPSPEEIICRLKEYLLVDNVPRTKKAVEIIIRNVV